jgi:glycosyltransferase involved in cell wall biosynthesis
MGRRRMKPGTILLVSQAFPPESVVGALRAANVARAFIEAGHRVIVVTAAMPGEAPGVRPWMPGAIVHTLALGPRYRDRFTAWLRRYGPGIRRPAAPSAVGLSPTNTPRADNAGTGGLRALALSLVWIPDDELRFVLPAYRVARRVLKEVDLVYTTAPPHSTNLVGWLVRRLHGTRWCAEFRDPWCYPQKIPITPFVERVNQFLERRCIRAADHLVTVAEQTAELYRQRLGPAASKVVLVRNGIPVLHPRPERRTREPFRIVYSGSIYGGRDPRAFLDAVASLLPELEQTGRSLSVDLFVSDARSAGDMPIEAYIQRLGIEHVARIREWVPHAEIERILRDADLLLLLAQRQPLQVPNKLYEYLGTGVPILALADADGETARMLRAVGGHYLVDRDNATEIAAALRAALDASVKSTDTAAAPAVLQEWLTERQMQRLVAAVRP